MLIYVSYSLCSAQYVLLDSKVTFEIIAQSFGDVSYVVFPVVMRSRNKYAFGKLLSVLASWLHALYVHSKYGT